MPLEKTHERLAKHCQDVYTKDFLEMHVHVENKDTGVQCVLMVEEEEKQLVVCFRGSDSTTDWRMNFHMSQSEYPKGSGRCVHSGFLVQWLSIEAEFKKKLEVLMEENREIIREVVFCGHSAGAQCMIAAYSSKCIIDRYSLAIKIVTFGAPKVGNDVFKKYVESHMNVTRIVLDRDVITRMPILGYQHAGNPIQIRDDCILERDTSTLEHLHWMILGARSSDAGIQDHFVWNYYAAIRRWLSENDE